MSRLTTSKLESYIQWHAKRCRSERLASRDSVDVGQVWLWNFLAKRTLPRPACS